MAAPTIFLRHCEAHRAVAIRIPKALSRGEGVAEGDERGMAAEPTQKQA